MTENVVIQLLQMDGEILVDSRIVAKGIGIEHQNFMETIYTYQLELEEFGVIRFETDKPLKGSLGGRPEKYAMLNRNQAGVAISFSRNTAQVVRFKVDLFKAIDKMEQQLIEEKQQHTGTKLQLAEAKAMIKVLVDEAHKLPWGLDRAELGVIEITCHRLSQKAEEAEALLKHGNLTDKRAQKILEALSEARQDAALIHKTLREDKEMNKRIDDLFFSFYDAVHPILPEPKNKPSEK